MKYTKLFALAILLLIATFAFSSSRSQPAAAQWEYKVIVGKCWDEKKLNAAGAEGWEMAGYSTWSTSAGGIETCIFKRPKT